MTVLGIDSAERTGYAVVVSSPGQRERLKAATDGRSATQGGAHRRHCYGCLTGGPR